MMNIHPYQIFFLSHGVNKIIDKLPDFIGTSGEEWMAL